MSKGYGVYTKVTHLCNRFQIACAIFWNIPGLYAINAKTCHIRLWGAHHLPLPTQHVGLHPMAQENYHRAQLTGFYAIPDEEFTSLNQSYSLLKIAFTWVKVLNMWDEMECWFRHLYQQPFEAITLQQLNRLVEISCWCGLFSYTTFAQVPLDLWGEYGQQWLIHKKATFATNFVTSVLTSAFSATPEDTKNAFVNFKFG